MGNRNNGRGKAFKQIRDPTVCGLERITLRNGSEIIINPMKHFLLKKEYKHPELQDYVLRMIGKHILGEKKYNDLVNNTI